METSETEGAQGLRDWLECAGAADYTSAFVEQGFASPDDVLSAQLSEMDLKELGIGMKARKAIMNELLDESPVGTAGHDGSGGGENSKPGDSGPSPSRFASELWDSFPTVLSDVRQQAQVCSAVSRYLQGRWQLEQDYSRRLKTLAEQLPALEGESVLLRPYGPMFELVAAAATAAANRHQACAAQLRDKSCADLANLAQWQANEIDQLSSDAARLRLHLRQAHSNLERDQTAYIQCQHIASASLGGGQTDSGETARAEAAYRRSLRVVNRLQNELYSEEGKIGTLLGRLEQLARAAPNAVALPAQQLIRIDGGGEYEVQQISELCTAATDADIEEYIVRKGSGRPRPAAVELVASSTPTIVCNRGAYSITLGSISPVRMWELNLTESCVTIRTASEEVTLQGSSIEQIERVPRNPCEATVLVSGLDPDSEQKDSEGTMPGNSLSVAATASMQLAQPVPLTTLRVTFPQPICRELFLMALRTVSAPEHDAPGHESISDRAMGSSDVLAEDQDSSDEILLQDREAACQTQLNVAQLLVWTGHLCSAATARRGLTEILDECVPRGNMYGLYVVGRSIASVSAAERAGTGSVAVFGKALGDHLGPDFVPLGSIGLPFVQLCAFADKSFYRDCTAIRTCAASMLQTRQATGGVALTLNYIDSPLAFVCLHIPPELNADRREKSKSAKEASDSLKTRCGRLQTVMQDLQKQSSLWPISNHCAFTSQYHTTVVLGELNFELNEARGSTSTLDALIDNCATDGEGWENLCAEYDQLRSQQRAARLLHDFREPPPVRAPVRCAPSAGTKYRMGWFTRVLCHTMENCGTEAELLDETDRELQTFPAPDPALAAAASLRLRTQWPSLKLPLLSLSGLPTNGCTIVLTGLRASGLTPARSGSVSGSLLGLVKEASTDPFLTFDAFFLSAVMAKSERSAAVPRTTAQTNTTEPSWDGERVVLRSFLNRSMLRCGLGSHLVVTARHQSMIGTDACLGEASIALKPMCEARASIEFSAELLRMGVASGRVQGEILIADTE